MPTLQKLKGQYSSLLNGGRINFLKRSIADKQKKPKKPKIFC